MLNIRQDCTACGACVQVCPHNCIELKSNEQGMFFPNIDKGKCIGCNLCEKVCHLCNSVLLNDEIKYAYAVTHPEKDVLDRSTSGGAFTAIAKYVLSKGGAVFGCAWTEHLIPRHICVETEQELAYLNGSKYVESEIGSTFKDAKDMLDNGRIVLYSGTPCQIAGLKAFLRKPYKNLITADIVCHGVAPKVFFLKYIDWLENRLQIRITNYDFRSKRNRGWSIAGILEGFSLRTGRNVIRKIFYFNEYYYYHFLKGTIYRDSCYLCKYANLNRPGDFTLGDLWGAEGLTLDYSIDRGCSLLLVNTSKAKDILQSLNVNKTEIPIEFALKYNKQLLYAHSKPVDRDVVLEKFTECTANEINSWFIKHTVIDILKGYLKLMIPIRVKNLYFKFKYR